MATSSAKQINWRVEILPRRTKKALDFLSHQAWLKHSKWYLAGGTALALQTGHRSSVDLDFFNRQVNYKTTALLRHFVDNNDWKTIFEEDNTIFGELFQAKVSFIAYPFFIPKQPKTWYGSVGVLQPVDIAVMKIIAISQRGRKRDFFDLYWCAKNLEPLEDTIRRLKEQYPSVAHDYHHILKSLVFFTDAESDPMPKINFKASWRQVKNFFTKEVVRTTRRIMDLN